jgi:hypothetical protein
MLFAQGPLVNEWAVQTKMVPFHFFAPFSSVLAFGEINFFPYVIMQNNYAFVDYADFFMLVCVFLRRILFFNTFRSFFLELLL